LNKVDEPTPALAHLAVGRPRKRGFFGAGRRSLGFAAALVLVAVAGTSVMLGRQFLVMSQGLSMKQVESVPVVSPAPSVVVSGPVKFITVQNDGWPDIMISALAASGKNHWCAILNGQLLGVGEKVDGVTVRSIRANGVVLEFQGQRRNALFPYCSLWRVRQRKGPTLVETGIQQ